MEILLVLALIGLLSAVLISGGAQLLSRTPLSPDEVFWSAVQEARKMALKSESDVTMRFADDKDKGKGFIVTNGASTKTLEVPKAGDLEVTFLVPQKGGRSIVIAGTVIETQKVEVVTFYADGTCSPFRVQFFKNGAAHITSIDPWTCAQVLTSADGNGSLPTS